MNLGRFAKEKKNKEREKLHQNPPSRAKPQVTQKYPTVTSVEVTPRVVDLEYQTSIKIWILGYGYTRTRWSS